MFDATDLMRTFPAGPDKQVTIANMQDGPFNRWAFRNMRRLLASASVWCGEGIHGRMLHVDTVASMVDDKLFDDMRRGFRAIAHALHG